MSSKTFTKPRKRDVDNAIYGVAEGEENAMRSLYELCGSAVYAYALTVCGNVYDAQDVMQDTFIKVYNAAPDYVSQGKPMSWILSIARNLCFDRFRSQARQVNVTDEALERQLGSTATDATDRLVIKSCLLQLDEEERAIVVMHAVGGVKHREIADELGIPLNTVLSKYRRAIAKLKNILEGGNNE